MWLTLACMGTAVHVAWVVRAGIPRTATKTERRSRGVLVVKREGGGGGEQGEHGGTEVIELLRAD